MSFGDVKYLKHNHIVILTYMCKWIAGKNQPICREFDGRLYYWFSLQKMAKDLFLSYQQVQLALRRLRNQDKNVDYITEPLVYQKMDFVNNRMYLSVNLPVLKNLVECKNELKNININFYTLQKRIEGNSIYTKRIGKMGAEALFDTEKPVYCKEADSIAKLILKKYPQYFTHRIPDGKSAPTKTYVNICKCIEDIYNGRFIRERVLSENFLNNTQFNIEGWQAKIKAVKGDWVAVKKLILGALKNFILMHDEDRMPYSKQYLQSNLNLWFYDSISIQGEGQSQFILCLFEPEYTKKHNSEAKADKIFETLSDTAKNGGNELFEMNTSMPAGMFWDNMRKMVEWGKNVCHFEDNAHYWISSASELPHLFVEYCRQENISVSLSTVDIQKAVKCNGPWTWFVKNACLKHGLNTSLAECVDISDFVDCYKKFSFDDMEQVVF